jgi:hypothetical protein
MLTCYLVGYPNLSVSFMCNVIEEAEDRKTSSEIPTINKYHGSRKNEANFETRKTNNTMVDPLQVMIKTTLN